MHARTVLASLVAIPLVLLVGAAPALAAGGGDPKIRVRSDVMIVENEVATLELEYRCATGTTATLAVSAWQGGTAADPVALYDTALTPPADMPELVCDGDRHPAHVTLILVGWDPDAVELPYEFFTIDRNGGTRVYVTATLTDDGTGRSDVDRDKVTPIGRD
jgi:hypothetical protein